MEYEKNIFWSLERVFFSIVKIIILMFFLSYVKSEI
jgi:hypothetical protein